MTKDELEAVRERYIQDLREGQRYSISKFDDQVLFISSGALVLSLSFIKEIVPLVQANFLWLLYLSWWILVTSIVISIIAHLVSYHQTERQVKRVENEEPLPDDKATIIFNYLTAILLVVGIAFQILFVTLNVYAMSENSRKKIDLVETSETENLSLPVQSAPKAINVQKDSSSPKSKTDKK